MTRSAALFTTALLAALAAAAPEPKAGLFKFDLGSKVKDAVQAKLDKPLAKIDAVKDAITDKKSLPALPDPRGLVVKSGGLDVCTPTATKKLVTMGQLVGGEYFGVMRTVDGSGGGYTYWPMNASNPYALPSNGAEVTAGCEALGLRAAIAYSPNPDIPTIHYRKGEYWMVSHRETAPGGMDMVRLAVDKVTGDLTPVETKNVDFETGLWFPCAGSVTPYDAHLGSEEFEPDCKYGADRANGDESNRLLGGYLTSGLLGQLSQWSVYQNSWPAEPVSPGTCLESPPKVGLADVTKGNPTSVPPTVSYVPPSSIDPYVCYEYGWSPEASPSPDLAKVGGPTAKTKKWRTLGRFSHEVSVFLNDKVVLMGDDRIAGMMGLFEADVPGDLSSGTLYAAKLSGQAGGSNVTGEGTEWDVSWIRLGHGTQGKLESLVPTIQFSDMFETAPVVGVGLDAVCPPDFRLVVTVMSGSSFYLTALTAPDKGRYLECLKLKPGMQDTAAFFETRRLAAYLGATIEFEKLEGVTVNPITKKAYAAAARTSNAATAGTTQDPPYEYDLETADHMKLPYNRCGVVFEADLGHDWKPTRLRVLLAGRQLDNTTSRNGDCDLDNIAGPDNVHVIPGTSTLLIAEDVDPERGHYNCFLWAYDTLRPERGLNRIGVFPYDAEVTGIYTSFVGKDAYLMYAVQHPQPTDPATGEELPREVTLGYAAPGNIGYIGPIPAASLTGVHAPALQAAAIEKATGKHVSPEWLVWKEAKKLQEVTFEAVPYESPGNPDFNTIKQQTTAAVCAGPDLV